MTWFKVDDAFAFHPKAISAGNAALGLWVRAGAWCSANLTDGRLPKTLVTTFAAQKRDAERLVAANLWAAVGAGSPHDLHTSPTPDAHQTNTNRTPDRSAPAADNCSLCAGEPGYYFLGWEEWQPTKEQVNAEREAAKARQKAWREKRRNGVTDGVTTGVTDGVTNAAPTRPDPTRTSSKEEVPTGADAPIVSDRFAEFWAAYPRKTAKRNAEKAWKAATKRTDPQQILDGLARFKFSDDPQFVAHPATWLNGDRWADQEQLTLTTPPPGGTWTEEQLTAVLGPDRWRAPQPPSDIPAGERWDWVQQQWLANRADRIRQAIAKQQGGVA